MVMVMVMVMVMILFLTTQQEEEMTKEVQLSRCSGLVRSRLQIIPTIDKHSPPLPSRHWRQNSGKLRFSDVCIVFLSDFADTPTEYYLTMNV